MGHDPVELAKRAKQKLPAMRVHGDSYTIMLNWIDISKCADKCINSVLLSKIQQDVNVSIHHKCNGCNHS